MISSLHYDATIDEDTGDRKKPDIITFYNFTKGSVDTLDKLCASYNVARNTRRWPLVVFFSMLNIAGINSYIIHSTNNEEKLLRRHYLRQLADALVKENTARRNSHSLQSDLKLKVLKRKAELGVRVSSEKKVANPDKLKSALELHVRFQNVRFAFYVLSTVNTFALTATMQ